MSWQIRKVPNILLLYLKRMVLILLSFYWHGYYVILWDSCRNLRPKNNLPSVSDRTSWRCYVYIAEKAVRRLLWSEIALYFHLIWNFIAYNQATYLLTFSWKWWTLIMLQKYIKAFRFETPDSSFDIISSVSKSFPMVSLKAFITHMMQMIS